VQFSSGLTDLYIETNKYFGFEKSRSFKIILDRLTVLVIIVTNVTKL